MGKLRALQIVRWKQTKSSESPYPNLEALIDEESGKVSNGWHLARWIVPPCSLVAGGVFLPLALQAHQFFWIGVAGLPITGSILGGIFHWQARQISPTQVKLRKKCAALAQRMVSWQNLTGIAPAIHPQITAALEEAAEVYMSVSLKAPLPQAKGLWHESVRRAQSALEEAMTQMLSLADSETALGQEQELAKGWAEPLLAEMKTLAAALKNPSGKAQLAAEIDASLAPISSLAEARAQLERLETAARELETLEVNERD